MHPSYSYGYAVVVTSLAEFRHPLQTNYLSLSLLASMAFHTLLVQKTIVHQLKPQIAHISSIKINSHKQ